MKTYTKAHASEKAAKSHEKAIKVRGGKVTKSRAGIPAKTVLKYTFRKK